MEAGEFPAKSFNQALLTPKTLRKNLTPFLEEFKKVNIPWIFESFTILYFNLSVPEVQANVKFSSMLAVKVIAETGEYIPVSLTQAYILPIIKKTSIYDPQAPLESRGSSFFTHHNCPGNDLDYFSFNYVKLCTEMLAVFSMIKPKRLFYEQQMEDLSQFNLAKNEIFQHLAHPPKSLVFFKEQLETIKDRYDKKLKNFELTQGQNYADYVYKRFYEQLKKNFTVHNELDLRELLKQGDYNLLNDSFELIEQAMEKSVSCNTIKCALQYVISIYETGLARSRFFLESSPSLTRLVKDAISIPGKDVSLARGQNFMLCAKKSTPEERKALYCQLLRSLQFLAHSDPAKQDLLHRDKPSRTALYYELLKNVKQYEFPVNPLLKKQIKQTAQNHQKHQGLNQIYLSTIETEIKNLQPDQLIESMRASDNRSSGWAELPMEQIPLQSNSRLAISQSNAPEVQKDVQENNLSNDLSDASRIKAKDELSNCSKNRFQRAISETSEKMVIPIESTRVSYQLLNSRLNKMESEIGKLHINQQQLPQSMNDLLFQDEAIRADLENNQFTQNELDNATSRFISLSGVIKQIRTLFQDYSASRITYQQFSVLVIPILQKNGIAYQNNSVNLKMKPLPNLLTSGYPEFSADANADNARQSAESDNQMKQVLAGNHYSVVAAAQTRQRDIQDYTLIESNQNAVMKSRINLQDPLRGQEQEVADETKPLLLKGQMSINFQKRREPPSYDQSPEYDQDLPDEVMNGGVICGPGLEPMDNSFHQEEESGVGRGCSSFKDAFCNDFLMKGPRKENAFWLRSEIDNLVKPASRPNSKSQIQQNIGFLDIVNEHNRKHEHQIKMLEQHRNKKIKELSDKLKDAEQQKSILSHQLKETQEEVKSLKEQTGLNSQTSFIDYISDQNAVLKKLGNHSASRRKDFQKAKKCHTLNNNGTLLNTQQYHDYFSSFGTEKSKKAQLKNKQLLYKDANIEIGCMGHREGDHYKITCYVTPDSEITLERITVESDSNVDVVQDEQMPIRIPRDKQEKVYFILKVKDIPYQIPAACFFYKLGSQQKQVRAVLPGAFHKFIKIDSIDPRYLDESFNRPDIFRGQQIPYSKRAMKNLSNLQDYLPHIQLLNNGQTNEHGEYLFAGNAKYKTHEFPIKIFIKPNQFLYAQVLNPKSDPSLQKVIEFYIATLNHFLIKDIQWN